MKKNLDNLFQEKLTDLHELPNEKVWKSIEASLDQKKKSRRAIPIWWTLGGVAALLAIIFFMAQPKRTGLDTNSTITDTDQNNTIIPTNLDEGQENGLSTQEGSVTLTDAPVENQKNGKDNVKGAKEDNNSWVTATRKGQYNSTTSKNGKDSRSTPTKRKNNGALASADPNAPFKTLETSENSSKKAESMDSQNKNFPRRDMLLSDSTKKALEKNTPSNNAISVAMQDSLHPESQIVKKSIYDDINAQENEEAITDNNTKKWSLATSVAPVYFNGFGTGSPIHPDFASNSKSGNVNLSYGVFVSYEISKKLRVRSGVHKVDYGYDTDDVGFTSSFASTTNRNLANIDYAENAANIIVVSTSKGKPATSIQGEISGKTPAKNGSMIQQLGYLEIPLELNYTLLDQDFGIHLIGGFSSLFLTDNAVLLEANGLNTEIGEANNINDVNFSSNIGFGLNYKFSPKIKLNIEPVFKYQLNTFSNSVGDFKPFSIGIYSGFNFEF
ncbi:hypothetical protein [Sediminicola sp. 1XM1-17]|uniref:hypothetical protein n=1 Tax=Sediminicola sp. 1XM1-17 TaxID=3127702 RepID=UPI0030768FF1